MPLITIPKDRKTLENRSVADVQQELSQSNAGLRSSYLRSIIRAQVGRDFEFYLTLAEGIRNNFVNTATGEALEGWGAFKNVVRNAATQSTGNVVFTGVAGTTILLSTELISGDNLFETDVTSTITSQSLSVSSITRSGSTATATTASDHGLASNIDLTISGADQTEYNGTFTITVTGTNTFEYTVTGTPVTPATGTILATLAFVNVPITSKSFGSSTNLEAGTELKLTTTIPGANNSAYVDFNTLGGGTDLENDEDFRDRAHETFRFPVAYFNTNFIKRELKKVPGITRVFVEEITPAVGEVTIYFLRDNDDNPIPDGSEVTTAKNALVAVKPADRSAACIHVLAPTGVSVDFTFTALSPNTATMRSSITASLQALFDEETSVGQDLLEDDYRCAIRNTIDTATGDRVVSFTLSAPSGTVSITTGEIPVLGTVIYP